VPVSSRVRLWAGAACSAMLGWKEKFNRGDTMSETANELRNEGLRQLDAVVTGAA